MILDGSTSVAPDLGRDPWPAGPLPFHASELATIGFDAGSFAIESLVDELDHLSTQVVSFTH